MKLYMFFNVDYQKLGTFSCDVRSQREEKFFARKSQIEQLTKILNLVILKSQIIQQLTWLF